MTTYDKNGKVLNSTQGSASTFLLQKRGDSIGFSSIN